MEIIINLINQILPVIMFVTGFYFGHHLKKHDELPNIAKEIKKDIQEAKEDKENAKKKKDNDKKLRQTEEYLNNIENYPYHQTKIE